MNMFTWSPESDRLIFVDELDQYVYSIMSININGSEPVKEITPAENYLQTDPSWSRNGNQIAYMALASDAIKGIGTPFYSLWVVDEEGKTRTELTTNLSINEIAEWSFDSEWIAFSGSLLYEEPEPLTELWLLNPNDHELKRLTSNLYSKSNESNPQWSPGGSQIVFLSDPGELWRLSLGDGSERKCSLHNNFTLLPGDNIIVLP
jgi:Tol biopolymer transport system component